MDSSVLATGICFFPTWSKYAFLQTNLRTASTFRHRYGRQGLGRRKLFQFIKLLCYKMHVPRWSAWKIAVQLQG